MSRSTRRRKAANVVRTNHQYLNKQPPSYRAAAFGAKPFRRQEVCRGNTQCVSG